MPLHEINERFTKSELFMMGWRSQEQHFHFKNRMKKFDKPRGDGRQFNPPDKRNRYGSYDVIPENLPEHFYNEDGEVDLSKVTGREAKRYMASIGMPFPEILPVKKVPDAG